MDNEFKHSAEYMEYLNALPKEMILKYLRIFLPAF